MMMSEREELEEKMDAALAQFIVDVGESGFILSEESENCFKDGWQAAKESSRKELEAVKKDLVSSDAALKESRANDMESMRQLEAAKQDAISSYSDGYITGKQAGRNEVLKELSEQEPVAWQCKPSQYALDQDLIGPHRREFTVQKGGIIDTTFWENEHPLIIRPSPSP